MTTKAHIHASFLSVHASNLRIEGEAGLAERFDEVSKYLRTLAEAAEDVLIMYGMGWDDGLPTSMEKLNELL